MEIDSWLSPVIAGWQAHANDAKKPKNSVRLHDGKTPYGVHPTTAAGMAAQEPYLSYEMRAQAFKALALHDTDEDTNGGVPVGTPIDIVQLVKELTVQGGSAQDFAELPSKPPFVQLLKLYDKLSNLMDGVGSKGWMRSRGDDYVKTYVLNTLDVYKRHDYVHSSMILHAECAV